MWQAKAKIGRGASDFELHYACRIRTVRRLAMSLMRPSPPEAPLFRRFLTLLVAWVALCTCREARAELTMPLVAPIPVTVDSSSAAAMQVVTDAREAYQLAWDQREAGNRAGALRTTEETVAALAPVLAGTLDARTRREMVER